MKSKEKGDIAVAKAISYFIERREEVLLPFGDKQSYDLVVERGKSFFRVQCKFTSHKSEYGIYKAPLRVMGGNRSRNSAKTYSKSDFDILFVYTDNGDMYEIPCEIWSKNRNSISLGEYMDCYKIKSI